MSSEGKDGDDPYRGISVVAMPAQAMPRWVVLVEDDLAVAQMYRLGLELHGFTVTIAGSGEELFRSLDGRAPDVIVLDYQLPGANGANVLERIRTDSRVSGVRVFMLSNFPPNHDGAIDRVFASGAIAWLQKTNTSPTQLAERLTEALELAQLKVFKV